MFFHYIIAVLFKVVRKVVPKEAEPEVKKRQLKVNERPAWGSKGKKPVVKMSERDPFYQQKKEERELKKEKRERQLQYLQELNKERIPALSKSPGRGRDLSPDDAPIAGERGRKPQSRKVNPNSRGNHLTAKQKNLQDPAANILSLVNEKDKSPQTTGRLSPPIPSVRHRVNAQRDDPDRDPYQYTNNYFRNSHADSRYGDVAISGNLDGDFLPFMRTTEILDPSKAEEPMPISRENSRMQRARQAYVDTHHPASKGRQLDIYQDREREAQLKVRQ